MHIWAIISLREQEISSLPLWEWNPLFWGHRRIRKLNLKSGEGPLTSKHQPECGIPVTCKAGDSQSVLQLVACDWIPGSPRFGIHLLRFSLGGRVHMGFQHPTPSQSGDSFCFLEFPALFLPTSPLGLHPWKFLQESCAFAKPCPSGQSCKGNFCYDRPQTSPQQGTKHKYLTICWEEREQRNKNLKKKN